MKIKLITGLLLLSLVMLAVPAYSVSASAGLPTITAVYVSAASVPAVVNNGTTTTLTITGTNLTGVDTVTFLSSGTPDSAITSAKITPYVLNPDVRFTVDVTVGAALSGTRDVTVHTPSGTSAVFTGGLTIQRATAAVSAPATVSPGSNFWVTVNVFNVNNLNSSQFDLTFNDTVIQVNGLAPVPVTDGRIPATAPADNYPGAGWSFQPDPATPSGDIRLIQHLNGIGTVSGSGYLAKINFTVIGPAGSSSPLALLPVSALASSFGLFNSNGSEIVPDSITNTAVTVTGLAINTNSLPAATAGVSYAGGLLTATGGTPPYSWNQTGLPSGLVLGATSGVISGTPNAAGDFPVNITVTDSQSTAPNTATATLNLHVYPVLTITTVLLPRAAVEVFPPNPPASWVLPPPGWTLNQPYNASLQATGGTGTYAWSATGLPHGLTLSTAGQISGVPDTAGTFTMNVTVTDTFSPANTALQSFTLRIYPPGDANGDGVINAADIVTTEREILGIIPLTPGADANQNGVVDMGDVVKIERIILGLDPGN